jgi:hypothetical protein
MEGHTNVLQVEYLGIVVTDENYLHEEITNSLNSGIACQYSVHIVLFSCVLLKTSRLKYTEIMLSMALCECDDMSISTIEKYWI